MTPEAEVLTETAVKCDPSSSFLDDSDDFIQSHIDSHLPSSEEVKEEESDFEAGRGELEVQSDAESDLDNDGLSNIFEHENGLDLNREDTDSDGIVDGEEYEYWRNEKGLSRDESISNCMEPDVDGDDITDGKEINGYEAKVITGFTDDGEPISELRTIDNRDPTKAYKTESGEWSDTDSDGIPDVVESWFSNTSIATNPTYREQFRENTTDDLYDKYSWVVGHFHDIKEEENETKAEQWLTDQFNPMVREKTPPMVTEFSAEFYWDMSGWLPDLKVKTHVKVRDVGGIEDIELKDLDNGNTHTPELEGTPMSYEFEHTFDTSVLTGGIGSVELELSGEDEVGNEVQVEEEVKGAIDTMLDAMSQIWDAIAGVLSDVAEAVAEAVSVVVDWVLDKIEQVFMPAYNRLKEILSGIRKDLITALNNAYDAILNGTGKAGKFLTDVVLSGYFFNAVLGLVLAFQTISTILSIYSMGGAAALAGKAVTMVTTELAKDLFKHAVASGIALGGVSTISALLYFFKPKDDPFWSEGVGLAAMGFALSLWKTSTILFTSDPSGVAKEAFGLTLAFVGIILSLNPDPSLDIMLGSLILSGVGLLITVINKDVYDRLPIAPLKNIEETVSVLIVLYSIASIGGEFYE